MYRTLEVKMATIFFESAGPSMAVPSMVQILFKKAKSQQRKLKIHALQNPFQSNKSQLQDFFFFFFLYSNVWG